MSDIVERLRSSIPDWHGGVTIYGQAADCIEELEKQLAASQAREQRLREILGNAKPLVQDWCNENGGAGVDVFATIHEALAQHTDTSALEEIKAQVAYETGEVMRERCADYCETLAEYEGADEKEWASRIRALPSLTLEDLE